MKCFLLFQFLAKAVELQIYRDPNKAYNWMTLLPDPQPNCSIFSSNSNDFSISHGICKLNNITQSCDGISASDKGTFEDGFCFNNASTIYSSANVGGYRIYYFDLQGSINNYPINGEIAEQTRNSVVKCTNYSQFYNESCIFLANMCAASQYLPDSPFCQKLDQTLPGSGMNQNDYYDWPVGKPFLKYTDSFRNVISNSFEKTKFNNGDPFTIYLARYSKDGFFKGFQTIGMDILKCRTENDIQYLWTKFGYNYFSECTFDLYKFLEEGSTDFYDPYVADGTSSNGSIIIHPIPILVKNYKSTISGDSFVNRESDPSLFTMFRRFFLYENYLTKTAIQYLKNLTIVTSVTGNGIETPYLIVDYEQVLANDINQTYTEANVFSDEVTPAHPLFDFSVVYVRDLSNFWLAVLIVFIIVILLGVLYWVVHAFLYAKQYGQSNVNGLVVLFIISSFCDIVGSLLGIIVILFGLYFLFFFKMALQLYTNLPLEAELSIINPLIWVSFALKGVGVILSLLMKMRIDFFLLDWERPAKKNMNVSAWRRIMIANEWVKISTKRVYSIPFTMVVLTFILEGFNVKLLSSPIPTVELYNIPTSYNLIRYGLDAFLYFLLMLFEWLFCRFIYWEIYDKNPFENFIRLCKTSNVSAMFLLLPNHGYYLHGNTSNGIADDDLDALNQQMDENDGDVAPNQGLQGNNQITYEMFLSKEFSHWIQDRQENLKRDLNLKNGKNTEYISTSSPLELYNQFNKFFCGFIAREKGGHMYIFHEYSFSQYILDFGPGVCEDSVFTPAPKTIFKEVGLYGMQGSLLLFYFLLFAAVDCETNHPSISAFVVYLVDVLFKFLFTFATKRRLANKALLDSRFLTR